MSAMKNGDTAPGNVDNYNLLTDLRREHKELEFELKKIDTDLRRIGTTNRSRNSSINNNISGFNSLIDDEKTSSNKTHYPSRSVNKSSSVGDNKYHRNYNKRKNYDNTSDSESISSVGDQTSNTRRGSGSSQQSRQIKPAILSSVVTLPTSQQEVSKQRIEAIEFQKNDKKGLARNKRMFGMILGTLEKFQSEESCRSETTQKRSKIEKKLEVAVEEERAVAIEERDKLIANKQIKQQRLDKLDLKLDKVQRHENWELSHRHLGNFIKTDVKPSIFWLPRLHTAETEKKLRESRDYYKLYVAECRAKVKRELEYLDKEIQSSDGDQSAKINLIKDSNSNNDEVDMDEGTLPANEIDVVKTIAEETPAPAIIGLEEFKDAELL